MAIQLSKFGIFGSSPARVPMAAALKVLSDVGRLIEQAAKMQAIKPDNPSNVNGVEQLRVCRGTVAETIRNSVAAKQLDVEVSVSNSLSR